MTPMASVTRGVMKLKRTDGDGEPRSSGVTFSASMSTDITITIMPISARPEARESLWISLYKERGYETVIVQNAITNWRELKSERTGVSRIFGKADRMTWGIVSPKKRH